MSTLRPFSSLPTLLIGAALLLVNSPIAAAGKRDKGAESTEAAPPDTREQAREVAQRRQTLEKQLATVELSGDALLDAKLELAVLYALEASLVDPAAAPPLREGALGLYQELSSGAPAYGRADEVVLGLARSLDAAGRANEAVAEYTRLVKTFPNSRLLPEAYVGIGDYYFDQNSAFKALMAYQKAAAFEDSPVALYARYRLAWCYYNVGEYEKAIENMKAVAEEGARPDASARYPDAATLRASALQDLFRFFADAGQLDEAQAWYGEQGRQDLFHETLYRLGDAYFQQGKFTQALDTWQRLAREAPDFPRRAELEGRIAECQAKLSR